MKLLPFIRQVMKWKKGNIFNGMGICRRYRILSDGEQSALLPGIRGAFYKYTDRAKALGEDNFSTHRVSVGFIWQMPVF